ncbi:MAG: zinc-ribbon domain-containing protein [Firmicutes bacterium]|nr:zinc-ribbon domain-containing protein [Bacillota bacterium]
MLCPKCGKENKGDAKICAVCGAELITVKNAEKTNREGKDDLEIISSSLGILGVLLVPFVFTAFMGILVPKHINRNIFVSFIGITQLIISVAAIFTGLYSRTLNKKRQKSVGKGTTGDGIFLGFISFFALLISGILTPGFVDIPWESKWVACQSNLKNIAVALEMYSVDNKGHYPPSLQYLVPTFIEKIPVCPEAGKDTYSSSYTIHKNPDIFTFYCSGANHTDVQGVHPNHPQYSSVERLIPK